MKKILVYLFIVLSFKAYAGEQVKSVGFSFVQNYSKEKYKAGTQIWSMSQDSLGIMYFANNAGLLVYDGKYWRTYPVPNYSVVRSVKSVNNRIYVGAATEFGYFSPNQNGELTYTSLIDEIPVKYRNFGEVWGIMEYDNGIVFTSFDAIFEYKDNKIEVLSFKHNLHFSFQVDNDIYGREIGKGLFRLQGKTVVPVPGGEYFANITVSGILPYSKGTIIVVTREKGIYLLDSNGVRIFTTPLQGFFKENQIFCSTRINDNDFAFGTTQNGIIIMDRKGNLIQHLNRSRGLQNNTVLSVFTDHSGNLWLGLDNGIDYIIINSPFSRFADKNIVGAGYSIALKGHDLYFGTNQGLFHTTWPRKPSLAGDQSWLHLVDNSQGQVWSVRNLNNLIIVGHDKGTFVADGNKMHEISNHEGGWNISFIPDHPDYAISGTYSGLVLFKFTGKSRHNIEFVRVLPGFNESSKQIQFDNRGYLWIGHAYRGVFRLKLSDKLDSIIEVRHYTKDSGLPTTYQLNVLKINDRVVVSSNAGIFQYDYDKNTFRKDTELTSLFGNKNVYTLIGDENGNKWFFSNNSMGILKPNFDGTFNSETLPFLPLKNHFIESYESVYTIDHADILITTEDGIVHFDPTFKKNYNQNFGVLLREVDILPDSVIYAGNAFNQAIIKDLQPVDFKFNALRFKFSALFYESPEQMEYSYKLQGFDPGWSDWSKSSEKEYTNLSEGNYSFVVRARNVYGVISEAAPYSFIILPPWYRSTLAYVIYSIVFFCVIVLIVIIVIRRFEREREEMKKKQHKMIREKEQHFAAEALKAEQEIIKLRNEKLEAENQRNKLELDNKTSELASIAMQMTYKNELLTQVKQKLSKVTQTMIHRESKYQVEGLIKTLEKDIVGKDDWEKFEYHFDQVHQDFIKKLRKDYPELTPKDLKLCAYLRMNLASKEIAPLLNISIRGVEISRYRLRKKMYLSRDVNLTEFLMNIA